MTRIGGYAAPPAPVLPQDSTAVPAAAHAVGSGSLDPRTVALSAANQQNGEQDSEARKALAVARQAAGQVVDFSA